MSKHSAKCKLCPACGSTNRDVLQSRRGPHGIHRRSQCRDCGTRYSTNEHSVAEVDPKTTLLLVRLRDQINELETAVNDLRTTLESAIQLP
jgi:transcriptional regulator NrdR family protein